MAVKMFMPGLLGGEQPPAAATNGGAPAAPVAPAAVPAGPPQMGVLVPLQPFIVNLVDPSGKRYLKLTLSLELNNEQAKPEVDTRLPQVRDAVLLLLSSLTFDDIRTVEGKMRLRQQIISRCNTFLATGQVTGCIFRNSSCSKESL
jgi:flagellar FliL protein